MSDPPSASDTFPHGLFDFDDFARYRADYVIPYLLADLQTIYQGQRSYWRRRRKTLEGLNKPGRGDFFLPLPLFALMDHLGKFLAKPNESIAAHEENIGRVALLLPSVRDIPSIFVNLARNPAVHDVWPVTDHLLSETELWGFGFHLSGSIDAEDHNVMTVDRHDVRSAKMMVEEAHALKLYVNLHVLRRELDSVIRGREFEGVENAAFDRVRRYRFDRESEKAVVSRRKICTREHEGAEIRYLRDQAVQLRLFEEPQAPVTRQPRRRPDWMDASA